MEISIDKIIEIVPKKVDNIGRISGFSDHAGMPVKILIPKLDLAKIPEDSKLKEYGKIQINATFGNVDEVISKDTTPDGRVIGLKRHANKEVLVIKHNEDLTLQLITEMVRYGIEITDDLINNVKKQVPEFEELTAEEKITRLFEFGKKIADKNKSHKK